MALLDKAVIFGMEYGMTWHLLSMSDVHILIYGG